MDLICILFKEMHSVAIEIHTNTVDEYKAISEICVM